MERKEILRSINEILSENKILTIITSDGEISFEKNFYAEDGGIIYALVSDERILENIREKGKCYFLIQGEKPDRILKVFAKAEILGEPQNLEEIRKIIFRKSFEAIIPVKRVKGIKIVRLLPAQIEITDLKKGKIIFEKISINDEDLKILKELKEKPKKLFIYFRATRPFAFTASFISLIIGTFLAPQVNFWLFLLVVLGIITFHAGVNALNDHMDYKYGVDDWLTIGSSRVLQDGLMSEKEHLNLIIFLFIISLICGIILTLLRGIFLLIIILIGAFLGIFYQLKPLGLKYRGLGDISVFLAFGPFLSLGAYYVQTKEFSWLPFILIIPSALIVVGILHGNNFRDIEEDARVKAITPANLMGYKISSYYYLALVSIPYILTVIFVILKLLPFWTLIVFLSLPQAIRNIQIAFNPSFFDFVMLDLLTAKLNTSFGLLYFIGILLGR
ncbi:MAG: prenyltransferase [candidate division WOR-3 bacterium]